MVTRKVKKLSKQPLSKVTHQSRLSYKELIAEGKALRTQCARQSHAEWKSSSRRREPLAWILEANVGRIPQLVPLRHGRMLQSPFAFYRATALNMAADLAATPTSGLRVQACGDCHLMNFGAFATPERRVIFDINDLDETLPAPWEWDVKRLAASFVLACRHNGFSKAVARDAVLNCVRSYRERMAEYSQMTTLEVWFSSNEASSLIPSIRDKSTRKLAIKRLAKARKHNVLEDDFPELVGNEKEKPTIKENPPIIFHPREKAYAEQMAIFRQVFARYRETLQEDRRLLLDRFEMVDYAIKVVGVGSVGTICGVILLMASDHDPLFLQVKQAGPSVLERFAGKSRHRNHGERIVHGCRVMQSASDLFLGWTEGKKHRQFYIRQLKDMKIKPMVESFNQTAMLQYGEWCGRTLAQAHARSGEPAKITGYLGKSDKFDQAIADFSRDYADQCERDYEAVALAARKGKLEVLVEPD